MQPFYLIVHSDHPLNPHGPNSGAEMATLNQARYLVRAGRRVVVAASLVQPVERDRGVEFWDLGPSYDVEAALDRADGEGDYYLIAAGRAIALMMSRRRPRCLKRLLVTHDRCAGDSGIKPGVLPYLADSILCVSRAQREKLISEGAPGEIMVVVHNGVDFSIFYPGPAEERHPRRLLFSGALVPDKGLHLLIRSFVDLRAKYPDLLLDVYGSASLWSRTEYLDIESLARQVPGLSFHGKQGQTVIADGLRRSALCVVPSIWFDPYPLTSLEAQGCGCPVVAFGVGGLPEGIIQGKTGVVVDEIEQDALTRALDVLLSQPELLRQMSQNAADHAAKMFRWERVINIVMDVCEGRDLIPRAPDVINRSVSLLS
jgi:glycosyltransferase involved in cell wall biosynthesis